MLGREHDLRHAHGLAVLVAHGDLALGIRTELVAAALTLVAQGRENLENLVGIIERRRHEFRGLAAGIAEHDALVAGTLVLVAEASTPCAICADCGCSRTSIFAFFQWKPSCS